MLALKRIVTVAVMAYLLIALLFLLFPALRVSISGMAGNGAPGPYQERDFFMTLCWVGVAILALHLITENLDSTLLRRTAAQQDNRINELKAKLYDVQQPASRPVATTTTAAPSVSYPTAAEARRSDETSVTPPPTY
jgi:hypothetical protein